VYDCMGSWLLPDSRVSSAEPRMISHPLLASGRPFGHPDDVVDTVGSGRRFFCSIGWLRLPEPDRRYTNPDILSMIPVGEGGNKSSVPADHASSYDGRETGQATSLLLASVPSKTS